MDFLKIENAGAEIVSSNFWGSEYSRKGYYYLSVNAGAFRLLVPQSQHAELEEMRRGARYVVVSMLPKKQWEPRKFCVQWVVEDGGEEPYAIQMSEPQIDRICTPEDIGKQWIASIWNLKKGVPHKCLERPAFFQIVPALPWLKKINPNSRNS
ncbi:MAG: hypothetical protein LBS59_01000 [Puniceicoccales bacterium]|jgi:hypothetical protein|nr:hypothetical protein [Puniceicoccales bacterium]